MHVGFSVCRVKTVHCPWRHTAPSWGEFGAKFHFSRQERFYLLGLVSVSLSSVLSLVCSDPESFWPLPRSRELIPSKLSCEDHSVSKLQQVTCRPVWFFFQRVIRFKIFLQGSKKIAHISKVMHTHHELQSLAYEMQRGEQNNRKASHIHKYTMWSIK